MVTVSNPAHQRPTNHNHCFSFLLSFILVQRFITGFTPEHIIAISRIA